MQGHYKIIAFTAREVTEAGYAGPMGGVLRGTHYAIYEVGKGLCSLDGGKTVYMLTGKNGLKAMKSIVDAGGFAGEINYRRVI